MEDKRRFWPFLLAIPLIAAAVAGWFVLPEELVMQIGVDGRPSNIMPKLFGLLIPRRWDWWGRASPQAPPKRSTWRASLPWLWRS